MTVRRVLGALARLGQLTTERASCCRNGGNILRRIWLQVLAALAVLALGVAPSIGAARKQLASPKNVVASATSKTSITVTFSSVPDADSYTVYIYGATGKKAEPRYEAESGVEFNGLSVCTGYRISVQAVSASGSALSSVQSGKADVTTQCNAPYIPTFDATVPTSDGYTVQVTNYDPAYSWTTSVTAGTARIDGSGLVTVSGVNAGVSTTLTVTASRASYSDGSASVTALAGLPISKWIGGGDFTIEFWVKPTINYAEAGRQELVAFTNSAISDRLDITYEGNAWNIYTGPSIPARFGDFYLMSVAAPAPTPNVWTHVALTRQSGTVRLYVAGSQVGSDTSGAGNLSGLNRLQIGADVNAPTCNCNFATGLLSNVRVLDGTALYTGSTYAIPVSKLTAIAGTTFLLTPLLGSALLNSVSLTGSIYYWQDIVIVNGQPTFSAFTASGGTGEVLTSPDAPF